MYGKHAVIAAYIGLSAQLDAFYMATTVLSLCIYAFGDLFDSVGIPRLVKILREEGGDAFRELSGSILSFASILALVLCLSLVVISPWVTAIAPGFSQEKKGYLLGNLLYLAPLAILYLPYHALGSFLRARRRFSDFYVGELLMAVVSLVFLLKWHDIPYSIPISYSIGHVVAFVYVVMVSRKEFYFTLLPDTGRMAGIPGALISLFPVYLLNYIFVFVDRIFASYLPTGGVSALTYALLIVLVPTSIMPIENVFITPLAEAEERGDIMRRILVGIWIISIPVSVFMFSYGRELVGLALERGRFHADSTQMTGDALKILSLAIPVLFVGPVCTRLFQILGEMGKLSGILAIGVGTNAILNAVFISMGMGIRGLALATTLAWYGMSIGYLFLLHRPNRRVFSVEVGLVFLMISIASVIGLGASYFVPLGGQTASGILLRGVVYLVVVSSLIALIPYEEIRYWRRTVSNEIFSMFR